MSRRNDSYGDFADSGRRIGLAFVITTILFIVASVLTLRFLRQLPETIRQLRSRELSSSFELLHMASRVFTVLGFLSMGIFMYLLATIEIGERRIVDTGFRESGTYDPMDPNIYSTYTYTNQVDTPLTAPLFGFGGICLMSAAGIYIYIRFSAQYSRLRAKFPANGILIYKIKPPQNVEYRPDNIHEFVKGLAASFPALLLQIQGNHEGVTWRVVDSLGICVPNLLEQHIRNTFPDAEIEVFAYQPTLPSEMCYRYLSQYKLGTDFILPMQYIEDFKHQDPLSVIVEALGHIQKGEQLTYSVALFGEAPDAYRKGLRMIPVRR